MIDRNDSVAYQAFLIALRSEMDTDPVTMNYNSTESVDAKVDIINDPNKNTQVVFGPDYVTSINLTKALFTVSLSSQDQAKVQRLFDISDGLNSDLSVFKPDLIALGGNVATAVSTIQRALSRAEVLFGVEDSNGVYESVLVTRKDWILAKDLVL